MKKSIYMGLQYILFIIILVLSGKVAAIDFEEIKVISYLHEPFRALVKFKGVDNTQLNSLEIKQADIEYYEKINLERPSLLDGIVCQLDKEKGTISLSSQSEVISEPYFSILLEISTQTGRFFKHYVILLNPKTYKIISQQAKPKKISGIHVSNNTKRVFSVKYSQTLWSIAKEVKPAKELTIKQMVMALYKANPSAFNKNNINGLKAGYRLLVPAKNDVQQIPSKIADRQVQEHHKQWPKMPESEFRKVDDEGNYRQRTMTVVLKPGPMNVVSSLLRSINLAKQQQDDMHYSLTHSSRVSNFVKFKEEIKDKPFKSVLSEITLDEYKQHYASSVNNTSQKLSEQIVQATEEVKPLKAMKHNNPTDQSLFNQEGFIKYTVANMSNRMNVMVQDIPSTFKSQLSYTTYQFVLFLTLITALLLFSFIFYQRRVDASFFGGTMKNGRAIRKFDKILDRLVEEKNYSNVLLLINHELAQSKKHSNFSNVVSKVCQRFHLEESVSNAIQDSLQSKFSNPSKIELNCSNGSDEEALENMVAHAEEAPSALLNLATTYFNMKDYMESEHFLRQVLAKGTQDQINDAKLLLEKINLIRTQNG